jgi:hypothetical protein
MILAYLNEDISLTEEIHFKSIMKLHIPDSMATYSVSIFYRKPYIHTVFF